MIKKIYEHFGEEPFTCKDVINKVPEFRKALITMMHNTNVIRLVNRKKRAVGISKKNPSMWIFTTEALFVLQRYK